MLAKNSHNYLSKLTEIHGRSGLSLREVARECDLDPSYIHYILKGARRPQRDVIIALGFAYRLERVEVDEILLLAGLIKQGLKFNITAMNIADHKDLHLQCLLVRIQSRTAFHSPP